MCLLMRTRSKTVKEVPWSLCAEDHQAVPTCPLPAQSLRSCEVFSDPQFSSVQLLSHVRLFATSWTAAHQASLSNTNCQSLLKLKCIESVRPSSHLIHGHSLLLPPSIFPSIRVFSNESVICSRWPKYWSFSFSISPSNEYSGL